MPSYAVIDVGTNSVKFNLSERRADGSWQTITDRAEITRLGEDLQNTGEIGPEAMERTVAAIAGMVDEARQQRVADLAAVGTMVLRTAKNSQSFLDAVEQQCGVKIEVISGEDEARLAYLGVISGIELGSGSVVIFDTGGGSTQFTFGKGNTVNERFSVNVGAVRYTGQFSLNHAVSPDKLRDAMKAIGIDFARLDNRVSPDALVGMGGAITNMSGVQHKMAKYDPAVVQGSTLERSEVDRQIELYRSTSLKDRGNIVGLQPKRADVILAGACIVRTVMEKLGQDKLRVSDRGLRHGVLIDRFGNSPA